MSTEFVNYETKNQFNIQLFPYPRKLVETPRKIHESTDFIKKYKQYSGNLNKGCHDNGRDRDIPLNNQLKLNKNGIPLNNPLKLQYKIHSIL